jgi:hypothetical protein
VRAFGAGREFGGVLRVVLVVGDALLACAVAWLSSVKIKPANIIFFSAECDVMASHDTVAIIVVNPLSSI